MVHRVGCAWCAELGCIGCIELGFVGCIGYVRLGCVGCVGQISRCFTHFDCMKVSELQMSIIARPLLPLVAPSNHILSM